MARPPARRPSRRSRSGSSNTNQLSFFDPAGELQALHREERQLRTQKRTHDDHRRFLEEAVHNARGRIRAAEEDLVRAQKGRTGRSASEEPASRVVIARGGQPLSFSDRAAAGAALLAELRERRATLVEESAAIGLGDMAGLEMCVAVASARAPNEVVLAPAFRNDAGEYYPSADPATEFTLDDDPSTVIERFEAALGATPQALRQWSDSLAKACAELADYQQQLDKLPSFSEDRPRAAGCFRTAKPIILGLGPKRQPKGASMPMTDEQKSNLQSLYAGRHKMHLLQNYPQMVASMQAKA